jgi:predicted metal-dependent hydrolase
MGGRGRGTAARDASEGNPLQMPLFAPRDASPGWNVRISRRARRLSMRVFPGGRVEVVVPPGTGLPAIEKFVARHREWAERRAREFELLAPAGGQRCPQRIDLALSGQGWAVEFEPARRATVLDRSDGVLRVRAPDDTARSVGPPLLRWLAGVAAHELQRRLVETARDTGIDFARMHLRRQRTRWGSCSAAGTISLNMCLMFQRPAVVRYLLVHELCHRRQLNHSPRFWQLVETFEPGWRGLDAELLRGWQHVPAWVFPH